MRHRHETTGISFRLLGSWTQCDEEDNLFCFGKKKRRHEETREGFGYEPPGTMKIRAALVLMGSGAEYHTTAWSRINVASLPLTRAVQIGIYYRKLCFDAPSSAASASDRIPPVLTATIAVQCRSSYICASRGRLKSSKRTLDVHCLPSTPCLRCLRVESRSCSTVH